MKNLFLVIVGITSLAWGQEVMSPRIRGFRVYGSSEAALPVARLRSQPMTLEFDVVSDDPPALELKFVHCDRDWNITPTSFVNDEIRNRSKSSFTAEPSPNGVRGYRFHYSIRIPGYPIFDGFLYSGNACIESSRAFGVKSLQSGARDSGRIWSAAARFVGGKCVRSRVLLMR